jgi:hypothetical protein
MKKICSYIIIGFLLIAGTISADAALLIGTENNVQNSANIWVFDTDTCIPTLISENPMSSYPQYNFNGNAMDSVNGRFYFTGFSGIAPSPLYFTNFTGIFEAGTLDGGAACGTFSNGKYYYVKNGTDDLMEVGLDASGNKVSEIKIADLTNNMKTMGFGDMTYDDDGTLYGYATNTAVSGGAEFFIFNTLYSPSYHSFPQSSLIQMAFGADGLLYGHDAVNGTFFIVNKTSGDLTQICASYSPVIKLSDLAGFPPEGITPLQVPVDIKPMSCPNPLQNTGSGVLPVAILGTDEFDVSMVDPQTVLLEGVPAIRWNFEYASKPYEPYTGKESCDQCTRHNDRYLDLVLKFDKSAVTEALGNVEYGECRVLHLTGKLFDGTDIYGEDVVVIKFKNNVK